MSKKVMFALALSLIVLITTGPGLLVPVVFVMTWAFLSVLLAGIGEGRNVSAQASNYVYTLVERDPELTPALLDFSVDWNLSRFAKQHPIAYYTMQQNGLLPPDESTRTAIIGAITQGQHQD